MSVISQWQADKNSKSLGDLFELSGSLEMSGEQEANLAV